MSGTAGAQLITFLVSPLITRLYSPDALGVLAGFLAIVSILVPLSSLSYPMAIALPKKSSDAIRLVNISLKLAISVSVLVLVASLLLKYEFSDKLNIAEENILLISLCLALAIFGSTTQLIASQWAIRNKLFKQASQTAVIHSVVVNTLKVGLAILAPYGSTLIIISVLGTFIYTGIMSWLIRAKKDRRIPLLMSPLEVKAVAKEYKAFPLFRAPQGVLQNISQSVPVIFIATIFGAAPVGLYALCRSTLLIPTTLIGKSVNDVLLPRINELYLEGRKISPLLIKATIVLSLIALFPAAFFILLGPEAFTFIFGEHWTEAGLIAQWLILRFYFSFINRACVAAIPVLAMERFLFKNTLFSLLLSGIGLYAGYYLSGNYLGAIAGYSLLGVIPQVVIISIVLIVARQHDNKLLKSH